MKPLADCLLYAFVDTAYLNGRTPGSVAAGLCDGGADIIQLRAKGESPEQIQKMAEAILPITRSAGAPLVINDHPAVALAVGAEFCHLGQEDFFGSNHARISSLFASRSSLRLGLSTHSPEQAKRALAAGPDYIAIGPVYATPTKPGRTPVTLDYVRWATANMTIPWFAIGGITLENVDAVLAVGARRICVVSAILNAPNIVQACQQFKTRLLSAAQT